ncbi:MAG: RraA family protein [Pseudomonadota bacterium]|nr:RraA family protein [Pseudomonadota bacterium]
MTATPEQLDQLKAFGTATIYEAQGAIGALDSGMKPIDPTTRFAGSALTVDMRPADNLTLHIALEAAKPGDVLVVDAKGFLEAGPWGDVLTLQAMELGLAAFVIDGCVRDANDIIAAGFPVFCRGLSIKSTEKKARGMINVPVIVGGVRIAPGDILVGDRDGLVVVAKDSVAASIEASERRVQKEEDMRAAIRSGKTTAQLLGVSETTT